MPAARVSLKRKYYFHAHTYSQYGGSDNKIVLFSTIVQDTGNGIAWTTGTAVANGNTFTFLKKGNIIASIWMNSPANSAGITGLSLNSNQLTTAIQSITAAHRKCLEHSTSVAAATSVNDPSASFPVAVGDVFRPHTNGEVPSTVGYCGLIFTFEES